MGLSHPNRMVKLAEEGDSLVGAFPSHHRADSPGLFHEKKVYFVVVVSFPRSLEIIRRLCGYQRLYGISLSKETGREDTMEAWSAWSSTREALNVMEFLPMTEAFCPRYFHCRAASTTRTLAEPFKMGEQAGCVL